MKLQIDNACWLGDDAWFHWGTMSIGTDGRIAKLESDYASDEPNKGPAPGALRWSGAARKIDAGGMFFVPGLIDAHVHLREPGQTYKEGIANGTAAALKGGVTTVLDMPNNVPPITTPELFDQKRALFAAKSRVNYGLFLQATEGGARAPRTAAGVKIFMARGSVLEAIRRAEALAGIFRTQERVVLHAEDEQAFSTDWNPPRRGQGGETPDGIFHGVEKSFPHSGKPVNPDGRQRGRPSLESRAAFPPDLVHHLRRPKAAVAAALKTIEEAWRKVPEPERPRLVIAHVGTAEEIAWVARMKRRGHDIWAETCPHYFLFTEKDYLEQGGRLQVNPPLRGEEDRAAVYEAVVNGGIDFVSTDHAPHAPAEKADPHATPSGIAGIEWLGAILLTMAKRGEITWRRYLELSGRNAARCYGIEGRGGIREGAWADLVLVEAGKGEGKKPEKIVTRAAFHPYRQSEFSARVRVVWVNGRTAWVDGRVRRGVKGEEVWI